MKTQRRTFMIFAAGISGACALTACAQTTKAPGISDSDPAAVALGYSSDATKADTKKFPQYAAGQSCGSCVLYTGAASGASGACAAFGGQAVSAKGWCSAWVKKG